MCLTGLLHNLDFIKFGSYQLLRDRINDILLHLVVEEAARVPNINRRLDFVASKDPDFDSSLLERLNCFFDLFLELVLDSCRSDKSHASLNFVLLFLYFFIFSYNARQSLLKALVPCVVVLSVKALLCQQKRSKTFLCILIHVLLGLVHLQAV